MSFISDSEVEILDNYVPPSERKPRTPARKRNAALAGLNGGSSSRSSGGGLLGDIDGSPLANKRPATPASIKRERVDPKPKNAPVIFIGLDYGTTFTGLAYACLAKLDQIAVLMNLDDSNSDNPKIPSSILYEKGAVIFGNGAQRSDAAVQPLEWVKLLLVDEDDLPIEIRTSEHVMKARGLVHDLGKTAQEVISDYLRCVWSQFLQKIKTEVAEATVEDSRFHVVVTIPAIWPDYAKLRMREAVMAAGIMHKRAGGVGDTVLTFVQEPEAAALATLKQVDGRCDIQDGDSFVVCDCGGGTVDLIAYKVNSTEPMAVTELVKGSGGLHGAVFVDDRFKELFMRKLDVLSPNARDAITPKDLQLMTDDWIQIRKLFTGDPAQNYSILAPWSLYEVGILDVARDGRVVIHITSDDLKEVFNPVFAKIEALVQGQIQRVKEKEDRNPKYVIMVGGFGRCRYLYEFLKTRTGGVEVLQSQGNEPWTAICRGAVIHGMSMEKVDCRFIVEVNSRISRASYGIICQETWNAAKHLKEDKVLDRQQRKWKATNQMKWLIQEEIMKDKKFRHDFFRLLDERPESLVTTIWMCRTSPPPSRKDGTVTKYADVKWALKIDMNKLDSFINNRDEEFSQLDYVAEMTCSGGNTEFAIRHKGRKQAAKNVSVEFHDRADI